MPETAAVVESPAEGRLYCPSCGQDVTAVAQGAASPAGEVACPSCKRVFAASAADRVPHGFVRTWRSLGWAGPLAVAAAALPPLGSIPLFLYMGTISLWLRGHEGAGLALYVAAFAVLAGLALLPTYAQSALGGFAFGLAAGIPAALAGFAGGAVIGYELARRASGERVVRQVEGRPRLKAVRDAFVADADGRSGAMGGAGFWKTLGFVALLRLPPNSPFALTNLALASVRVPRAPFLLGTLIGMAPRTSAAVLVGTIVAERFGELSSQRQLKDAMPAWLFYGGIVLAFLVLGVIGHIANRAIARVTGPAAPAAGPGPAVPADVPSAGARG